jgi:hypothetical protein
MSKIYKVKISELYIRAENKEHIEDILWSNYGIDATMILSSKIVDEDYADND